MKVSTPVRRVAAAILMVIVAFWSTALCLAAGGSPHVSHGCCGTLKLPHQSVRIAAARICCAEDTANYDAALPTVARELSPSTFVIAPSVWLHDAVARGVPMARADVDAGRPPGPPTYVLISIFRI